MAGPQQEFKTTIPGDAGAIELACRAGVSPRAVAVIAHPHPLFGGTMDNKVVTTLARAMAAAGASAYRFNFRGVGKSQGSHDDGRGETQDMLAVISYARGQHPGLPLWLSGFSFGGAVALAAGAHAAANEMILVAPAFERLVGWHMAEGNAGVPETALVIHGENDETVLLTSSFDWARSRNVPVVVVPGADHFFHQRLHLIRQIVGRWLSAGAVAGEET